MKKILLPVLALVLLMGAGCAKGGAGESALPLGGGGGSEASSSGVSLAEVESSTGLDFPNDSKIDLKTEWPGNYSVTLRTSVPLQDLARDVHRQLIRNGYTRNDGTSDIRDSEFNVATPTFAYKMPVGNGAQLTMAVVYEQLSGETKMSLIKQGK